MERNTIKLKADRFGAGDIIEYNAKEVFNKSLEWQKKHQGVHDGVIQSVAPLGMYLLFTLDLSRQFIAKPNSERVKVWYQRDLWEPWSIQKPETLDGISLE